MIRRRNLIADVEMRSGMHHSPACCRNWMRKETERNALRKLRHESRTHDTMHTSYSLLAVNIRLSSAYHVLVHEYWAPIGQSPVVVTWLIGDNTHLETTRDADHELSVRVRPHYARFVVIRVLFVKKIASELIPIDTNIKRRVQIRRICLFALFANLI